MREASLRQQGRELHAAGVETARSVEETGFEKGIHRRFNFRNQNRLTVFIARLVLVVLAIVRGEELFGDVAGGAYRRIERLAIVLGETLTLSQTFGIEDFVQLESQIAGTEQRLGHGGLPLGEWTESRRGMGEVNRMIDERDGGVRALLIKCGSGLARECGV